MFLLLSYIWLLVAYSNNFWWGEKIQRESGVTPLNETCEQEKDAFFLFDDWKNEKTIWLPDGYSRVTRGYSFNFIEIHLI